MATPIAWYYVCSASGPILQHWTFNNSKFIIFASSNFQIEINIIEKSDPSSLSSHQFLIHFVHHFHKSEVRSSSSFNPFHVDCSANKFKMQPEKDPAIQEHKMDGRRKGKKWLNLCFVCNKMRRFERDNENILDQNVIAST